MRSWKNTKTEMTKRLSSPEAIGISNKPSGLSIKLSEGCSDIKMIMERSSYVMKDFPHPQSCPNYHCGFALSQVFILLQRRHCFHCQLFFPGRKSSAPLKSIFLCFLSSFFLSFNILEIFIFNGVGRGIVGQSRDSTKLRTCRIDIYSFGRWIKGFAEIFALSPLSQLWNRWWIFETKFSFPFSTLIIAQRRWC